MENDDKLKQVENGVGQAPEQDEVERTGRRKFLRSLGKWSMAVIGGIVGAATLPRDEASAWINRRGFGGWANRAVGGGWINGGGGGWANAVGGGGWLNNRGGGGWLNRRW